MSAERRYTTAGGYRIHSEHHGAGLDVVLLHGLSGSRRWWRYTVPALSPQYRVHVPELVGFGQSSTRSRLPTMTELATVVAAWMKANEVNAPHVVGHSMGGQLAIHLAAGHMAPRSLTLVGASGMPRAWSVAQALRFAAGALPLPPQRWGAPTFAPTIALDALRAGPRTLAQAMYNLLLDDVRPLLPRLSCPTLVVWGALDPLVPLADGAALAGAIPGARFAVIAEAAHNVMADRPQEFNRLLRDFLASNDAA